MEIILNIEGKNGPKESVLALLMIRKTEDYESRIVKHSLLNEYYVVIFNNVCWDSVVGNLENDCNIKRKGENN